MFKNNKILALIPARSGSKGLLGKNIRPFLGKPLIAWTIEQARNSKYIDTVIVSTDKREIAKLSKIYGAETPFLRPKKLSGDKVSSIEVILHAMKWMEEDDRRHDILILLQPTSPLRTAEDIDGAIKFLFEKEANAIISVCEAEHHPWWANVLPKDRCMKDFMKQSIINKNRQALDRFYRLNGAIYLGYRDYIKQRRGFFGPETFAYIMSKQKSIDIDSEIDFKLAEVLMRRT